MSTNPSNVPPAPSGDFTAANTAAKSAAHDAALPLLEGAKTLLENALTSAEASAEKILPQYESAVVATALHYAPDWTHVYLQGVLALAAPALASATAALDAQGKAGLAMAIASVDSAIGHIESGL